MRRFGWSAVALALTGVGADAAADDTFEPPPFVRATAAFESGQLERAEVLAVPLADGEVATAEACSLVGQIRLKQGRRAEAVTLFERAVATNPASAPLRSRLGAALLGQAEAAGREERGALLQRARGALERAAEDAGCRDAQMGLLLYHLLAPAAGPAGAAEQHAAAAVRLDPWDAPYEIATLAERHERPDLAERYYGVVADLIPANPWLRLKQAAMLARLGRVPEARAVLEAILKTFAGFPPARELLVSLPAA